jgi:hypothetical protein
MCVHCGASLQKKFPTLLAVLISVALAVSVAVAGYFILTPSDSTERIADAMETGKKDIALDSSALTPSRKDRQLKVIKNIPSELLNGREAINKVINNMPLHPKTEVREETETKPETRLKKQDENNVTEQKTTLPARASVNSFSAGEAHGYGAVCTYFQGRSKNNIVFFTTSVYGYVKVNGKVYALQGIQKGNDIARFSGAGFEVTIEILGLAGNENEWLAEATMVVSDVRQRTLSRHKIYSSCTDF